ncbi:AMP-binding protein [Epibacterium sp. SM1979]|uniref:AMP-binding protein n=1 Tax=Tritonibacter litoralis TaxID=2662264 RepID=A0A843YE95_9RHOB|nr:class I adenylate-forming enzyme family protein [Tritonibacter litoralis]MQQ07177.1 AMP-binding protein [Tritonibacter litoralis]
MLSIFDQGRPHPCPPDFNLSAYVLRMAQDFPTKTALEIVSASDHQHMDYATLEQRVRAVGTGLLETGLQPGDIVLLRLGNTIDFPIAFLGAIAAGLVPVPTSSQLTKREVASIIATLSPRAVLHDPSVSTAPHARTIDRNTLRAMWELPACVYDLGDPDRLAYVVYTSGTSGQARPVAHAHRAIWARKMMIRDWYGLSSQDRLMHAGAFNWTFTLGTGLMDPWSMGATAVIPDADVSHDQLPTLLEQNDVTIFAAVPGVYRKILKHSDALSFPNLRHCLSAGEKLSPTIRTKWQTATQTQIYEAFGMSECSTFISHGPGRTAAPDSLGRPQSGRRIAILNDAGPVPLGDTGVIAVHASDPGLMKGYIGAPDETRARFQGEWFLTGDHGRMTEDGSIFYDGRHDDMMNAGGFRVSPIEVEQALGRCPGLTQIAVTAVSPKPDVEIIAAFYVASPELDPETLSQFAETCLAEYKRPKTYQRMDALPTNPNGKLNRRALRNSFEG